MPNSPTERARRTVLLPGAALLVLALPSPQRPARIPVTVYPILGHGRDSLTAARLTRPLGDAVSADSAFVLVPATRARGAPAPAPKYGVVAELRRQGGSLALSVRVVDVPGVYLVARDSLNGSAAVIEAELPALAARVRERLTTLQRSIFRAGPPPSWLVPTPALRFYALAIDAADRGDTSAAVGLLRHALTIFPRYREACNALVRFGEDPPCSP